MTTEPVYVDTLDVTDFKRLNALTIDAGGTAKTVYLTGKNRQGKSSALDALWSAIEWKGVSRDTPNPVRDGADAARVQVTLSDGITVTRTWSADTGKTKLTVTGADGREKKPPQRVLDDLIRALTFDPLKFVHATGTEQYAMLVDAIDWPFDLALHDRTRAEKFTARTVAGRRAEDLEAVAAKRPAVPDDTPDEPLDAVALIGEVRAAELSNQRLDDHALNLARATATVEDLRAKLRAAEDQLRDLQGEAFDLPERIDTAPLLEQLNNLQDTNRNVHDLATWRANVTRAQAARAEWKELDTAVRLLDESKRTAIQEAQLPVDGVSFDEDERITYRGQVLSQCSGADRVEVSVGIAMALNPTLRVIRLTDTSLLDSESLTALVDLAEDRGFQLWVERASDGEDRPGQVVIEDGRVKDQAAA
jgi:hypothetical protein